MTDTHATGPQVIYGGQAFASGSGARATASLASGQSYESPWLPISVQQLAASASANGAGDLYIDVSNDKATVTSSGAVSVASTGAGSKWATITSEGYAYARLRFVASAKVTSLTWTLVALAGLWANKFNGSISGSQTLTTLEVKSLGVGTAASGTKGAIDLVTVATAGKSGRITFDGTLFLVQPAKTTHGQVVLGYGLKIYSTAGAVVAHVAGTGKASVPSIELGTHATLYSGATAPAATLGAAGDYYFRTGNPSTGNERLYVKDATGWQPVGASSPTATHDTVFITANVTTIGHTAPKNITSLALGGTGTNRWLVTCTVAFARTSGAGALEVALTSATATMTTAHGAQASYATTTATEEHGVTFTCIVAGGQTVYLNAQGAGTLVATALAALTHATAHTVTGIVAVKIA